MLGVLGSEKESLKWAPHYLRLWKKSSDSHIGLPALKDKICLKAYENDNRRTQNARKKEKTGRQNGGSAKAI